jgi:DNA polymerase I
MIAIDHWITREKIPAHMIMQVHDELVFEVREDCVDDFIVKIREFMGNIIKLDVPLIVDVGVGGNWDEASAH